MWKEIDEQLARGCHNDSAHTAGFVGGRWTKYEPEVGGQLDMQGQEACCVPGSPERTQAANTLISNGQNFKTF